MALQMLASLGEEVIRRGDYFLGAWTDAGRTVPLYLSELRAGYTSPHEYQEWFEDLALESHTSKAAFDIRELVPGQLLADY